MTSRPRSERAAHWERVHGTGRPGSWHQEVPTPSLELIRRGAPPPDAAVLDVGGGDSRLVDHLLADSYRLVGVLDVSAGALARAKRRLGARSERVRWIEADVTDFRPEERWDVWHDRAALHFLTDPGERDAYRAALLKALRPGGCAVIGTFGPEGPERCSGLPCVRYDLDAMADFLGDAFEAEEHLLDHHSTPDGAVQQFLHARFRRR